MQDLITKYNKPIPRYTSYPTAPEWYQLSGEDWQQSIDIANSNSDNISLYFHIPFCRSACYYCACNIVVSPTGTMTEPYLQALKREIDFYSKHINPNKKVNQLHFGGGTPTYLTAEEIDDLMSYIASKFTLDLSEEREFSVEVDPRVTTVEQLEVMQEHGFNRISMGLQDFDPIVQESINRVQSFESVDNLIKSARQLNYKSINVDLIYGLPHQTVDKFANTINQVIELAPDRIALFNYAHLPSLRPYQKKYIKVEDLPVPAEKVNIFTNTIEQLSQHNYEYIGLDHFVKTSDELATAYYEGNLHRNFQGYSTRGELDMFALGVTSISQIQNIYSQNTKKINDYINYWTQDNIQYPLLDKGFKLSHDDIQRRSLIKDILCARSSIDLSKYNLDLQYEYKWLEEFIADNLITLDNNQLSITKTGQLFIRNIASVFDIYLRKDQQTMFSNSV